MIHDSESSNFLLIPNQGYKFLYSSHFMYVLIEVSLNKERVLIGLWSKYKGQDKSDIEGNF